MIQTREASRPRPAGWNLPDAKAHFSEVVRRARSEGPQRVTVRGHDAVVVVAVEKFERLMPTADGTRSFLTFMESLSVDGLDLTRDPDNGRTVDL